MGFYKASLNKWFLYSYNVSGVAVGLTEVQRFNIIAYAKDVAPELPKRLRNDSK